MPTIKDVAKRAGVSIFTVSVVLNNKGKTSPALTARVLKAAADLNFTLNQVARSLQTKRTNTIGMIIPDMANPYYAAVVRGVEERLRAEGYALLLACTYDRPVEQIQAIETLVARQVDGIVMFFAGGDENDIERALAGKPVVFLSRRPKTLLCDSVAPDTASATGAAVRALADAGRKRIGLITGPLSLSTNVERVKGWQNGLRKAKLPTSASRLVETDWSAKDGEAAAHRLLSVDDPADAIVVASFPLLTGVLKAVRSRGLRCPTDVALFVSDDYEWLDVFDPPVSGVSQPRTEMGTGAATLLLQRLENPKRKFESIELECSLRLRGLGKTARK